MNEIEERLVCFALWCLQPTSLDDVSFVSVLVGEEGGAVNDFDGADDRTDQHRGAPGMDRAFGRSGGEQYFAGLVPHRQEKQGESTSGWGKPPRRRKGSSSFCACQKSSRTCSVRAWNCCKVQTEREKFRLSKSFSSTLCYHLLQEVGEGV